MSADSATAWGFLTAAVTGLGLGFFVYTRHPQGLVNRSWLYVSLAASVWALGMFGVIRIFYGPWVLGFARVAHVAYALIPLFFARFALALTEVETLPGWVRWADRSAGLFALLSFTPLVVSGLQTGTVFSFYPAPGPFYGH